MPDPAPFADRLKKGMVRIENLAPGVRDEEAMEPLHRSLERTLARLAPGNSLAPSAFRFQVTGGKALLFQRSEALPLEPVRIIQILNSVEVELQPGEVLELDGGLVAWLLHPEITSTDTTLRQADATLKSMKTGRDRDHAAAQSAESIKIRLRSRMTQLVAALQLAQKESEEAPADHAEPIKEAAPQPVPPKPAAPQKEFPSTPQVLAKALPRILAAIQRSGLKAAAIGEI